MTREEISKEIKEICERMMTYASEHEKEIKEQNRIAAEESEHKITQLLLDAKNAKRHSWSVYEQFKAKLSAIAINSAQYEKGIHSLTAILGV